MTRILLIVLLLFGIYRTTGATEISFKQTAEVNAAVIRLADVAEFDEKTELTDSLATLTVGQAPAPGEAVMLRAQTIRQALLSAKAVPQEVSWAGSPTIAVNRLATTIGPDQVMTIIADYLHDQKKNLPEAEVKFIPVSLPLPFHLPQGDLVTEVIPSNPGILGSSRFALIFRQNNEVVKNMSVRGRIEAIADVVVTGQAVAKGSILKPEMLTTAPTDISELAAPQFEINDLTGMKLTRSLRAGSPVLAGMIETLPVVHRGEKVKIVLNSGTMHLTATGFATADGKRDEMIRVQNLSSNKLIYCRVAAPGLVEVLL